MAIILYIPYFFNGFYTNLHLQTTVWKSTIIQIEMSKTWPKGKSGEGKREQIAEQPAKKSAKAKRGREPSW